MNEYDSERICSAIESLGYSKCEESFEDCELVILNTCSIREKADDKLYSKLGRINQEKQKLQKAGKYMILIVSGCVPETAKDEIFKRANYVDIILGPQSYVKLKEMIETVRNSIYTDKETGWAKALQKHLQHLDFSTTEKFDFLAEERTNFNGVSAFISVQEGCDKFCTYCVVPNTRGRQVSRPIEDIIKEVRKVASLGAKEIIFLGQNVTAFEGEGFGKKFKLSDLIYEIAKLESILRIRYTTSHPRDMHQDIIDAHKDISKLMPYLHLPVQSGSNNILKTMNRKYTREHYIEVVEKFRKAKPNLVLSSDFIVGFPGETDEDFQETLNLIEQIKYEAQCYSFSYSIRPETRAGIMKNQIENEVKSRRLLELQRLLEKQKENFNNACLNQELEVLFDNHEAREENQILGRSQYGQIVIINIKNEIEKLKLIGQIKKVKIDKILRNSLKGVIV